MKKLNDNIWRNGLLIPEIKEKLVILSRRILNDLEMDVKLKQLIFTGSLASYVWRASSDIDLHLIVSPINDYNEIADDYFDLYCKLFNSYHNIFIKGYKVEVNIKQEEKILDDKGVFDILTDKWIQTPSLPPKETLKNPDVQDLSIEYQDRIDDLINRDSDLTEIENLKKEIKSLRTSGLSEDGEYSVGNLVFKELRHSGYLKKLNDFKLKKEDETLSFEGYFYENSK